MRAPASLFLCPGFIEGGARLWWLELEEAVRRLDRVRARRIWTRHCRRVTPRRNRPLTSASTGGCAPSLRRACSMPARRLGAQAGVTDAELRKHLFLGWDDLAALASHPLLTFGAHSLTHVRLAQWPEERGATRTRGSKASLETRFGREIDAYLLSGRRSRPARARESSRSPAKAAFG